MKLVSVLVLVILSIGYVNTLSAEQQIRYQINNSYGDVIAAVERLANEPRRVPFKVPNLPALIEGKDIRITTDFRPSLRHYVVKITLEKPIGKLHTFNKTLEVWGKKDYYLLQSTVDIGWGKDNKCSWIAAIKQRILDKAECAVLALEQQKVMEYSARIGTKPVEQPITWGKIASDTFDLITLIVLKFEDDKATAPVLKSVLKRQADNPAKTKADK